MPEHISTLVKGLEPSAQAVVFLLWEFHEKQTAEFGALRKQLAQRDAKFEELQAQNEKFRKMLFGRRSEKIPSISSEVRRVIEEEDFCLTISADASDDEIAKERTAGRRKRGRKKSEKKRDDRRKALDNLPVIHEHVEVSMDALPSGLTRDDFRPLGDGETVRRLEHVREHIVVVEYKLEKLVSHDGVHIVEASAPTNVIDGGAWGTSVYAKVVVSKCVDSMPLYRQERALGRAGYPIARSVLCTLFHRSANILEPVYDRLLELVRSHPYVHADETRLPVAEPNNARQAWIWTLLCENITAYIFSENRSAQTPNHFLGGTQGHLIIDGYSGYNGVVGDGGRIRVGCWSHSRRKFFEALSSAPEARELLDLIVQLYRVEHEAADNEILGSRAHLILRQERSQPLVDQIDAWVDGREGGVVPKSPLGQALTYAKNQRQALRAFLDDSRLPLDNNTAEQAMKIVALGRKNFLFVGHADGGHNLAILQTICTTCLINRINPYEYLCDVLVRTRFHKAKKIDELLPMNWKPPPEKRLTESQCGAA